MENVTSHDSIMEKMKEPKYLRFNRLLVNDNMRLLALICNILDPSDADKVSCR